MLRGIRKASANWLGRAVMGVVMGLLAASFAIWGINDIFRGFGRSTIATVGNNEIGVDAFRRTYQLRLQQVERKMGHPLSADEAKALGLQEQVLSEMLAEAALNQRARQMRLGLPNAEIVRRITTDPTFQTPTGKFDRIRFEMLLRDAGYSEQGFIAEQRELMLRRQILESLTSNIPVPNAWLEAINEFQNQERSVQYLALGAAQAGDIAPPSADALKTFFAARKILFRAPEYRKLDTVQVTPASLIPWMQISDADIKAAYDNDRSRYVTPERRHLEEIVFPTLQEADAAEVKLKGGMSFAALAAARGLKPQDIDLGTVTKSSLVDPAVANAAFALKEGEVSGPIKGRFGGIIVTVLKIIPGDAKPFAEVAPQIRRDIAAERAKNEVQDLHDKIEDARAGGSTLEQAAQKLKLPVQAYEIDRSGRDPNGKLVGLPNSGKLVSAAFASDVGVDNDPLDADGGYVWYNVTAVMPAHDRSLDEVKKEVEELWRQDQIASRLKAKADDLITKLKAGKPLDELAKADNLPVVTADALKRGAFNVALSAGVINAIFHTAKGAVGSSPGDKPNQWIVFRVTGVTTPKPDFKSPDAERLEDTLRSQESNDIFGQYLAWLENDLGTHINQAGFAQAVGTGTSDTD